MSGIVEFQGGENYPLAVEASFEADAVVIRGFIDEERRQRLMAFRRDIPQHILCEWEKKEALKCIPQLKEARRAIKNGMKLHLGRYATLNLNIRRYQEELIMRRGGIKNHVDRPSYIGATAINVKNGIRPTYFYAERVAAIDANNEDIIFAVSDARADRGNYPKYEMALESGDAVIFTRGVEHRVDADRDRIALAVGSQAYALF